VDDLSAIYRWMRDSQPGAGRSPKQKPPPPSPLPSPQCQQQQQRLSIFDRIKHIVQLLGTNPFEEYLYAGDPHPQPNPYVDDPLNMIQKEVCRLLSELGDASC